MKHPTTIVSGAKDTVVAYDVDKTWEENGDVLCTQIEVEFADGSGCLLGHTKLRDLEKHVMQACHLAAMHKDER